MSQRTLRVRRYAGAAIALPLALLVTPVATHAHAHYDHSTPAIGAVLQTAPQRVDIYTDEEMAKIGNANSIAVSNAAGQRVDNGATTVDDADRRHFWVSVQTGLPPGRYVVSFTTLSDVDNDSDHGRFPFYVGRGPTAREQKLDAQLSGVTPSPGGSASHSGLFVGIGVIVLAIFAIAAGAVVALRRR